MNNWFSISTKNISGSIFKNSRSRSCCARILIWGKDRIVTLIDNIIYSWTLFSFSINRQNRFLNKWTFKPRSVWFRNHFFCRFFSDRMPIHVDLLPSGEKLIICDLTSSGATWLVIKVILFIVFNHWGVVAVESLGFRHDLSSTSCWF